ncbi:hypothetical protein [Alkalibacillus silvisoli]|uniref:Fur-regulated basic protein FbpA n=1 Tax=Alkalibacillus silvisoli TaxID=392823 RepID=A0ABP3JS89_9BACI
MKERCEKLVSIFETELGRDLCKKEKEFVYWISEKQKKDVKVKR